MKVLIRTYRDGKLIETVTMLGLGDDRVKALRLIESWNSAAVVGYRQWVKDQEREAEELRNFLMLNTKETLTLEMYTAVTGEEVEIIGLFGPDHD